MNGPKTGVPRRKRTTSAATTTCSSALVVASAVLLFAVLLAYGPMRIPFGRSENAPSHAVVSVGVLSACANFDRRAAVRATWGKSDAFHGVDFFLGICKSKDLLERVIREQAVHGDIVMAPKSESYDHIVHQTMHMMSVLGRDAQVTHVFKTDDDCYVKPDPLMLVLGTPSRGPHEESLTGFVEKVSGPIRDPSNKWCVSFGVSIDSMSHALPAPSFSLLQVCHRGAVAQRSVPGMGARSRIRRHVKARTSYRSRHPSRDQRWHHIAERRRRGRGMDRIPIYGDG
jgi:hypothetical protein